MGAVNLGQWLAGLRRARSLKLEDLSSQTKIHARFLDALERGDFDSLPSRAHARAFALAFARACGAEEEEASERVRQATSSPAPDSLSLPAQAETPLSSRAGRGRKKAPFMATRSFWLAAGVAAAAAGLGVLALPWALGALGPCAKKGVAPKLEPAGAAAALTPGAATEPSSIEELSLRARRPCWVVLSIDDQRLPTIILEPHKKETWRVRQKAVLLAGNIGAVRVWWRGENLGYLGELGARLNGAVFEKGLPWRREPAEALPLPPGVPDANPLQP